MSERVSRATVSRVRHALAHRIARSLQLGAWEVDGVDAICTLADACLDAEKFGALGDSDDDEINVYRATIRAALAGPAKEGSGP